MDVVHLYTAYNHHVVNELTWNLTYLLWNVGLPIGYKSTESGFSCWTNVSTRDFIKSVECIFCKRCWKFGLAHASAMHRYVHSLLTETLISKIPTSNCAYGMEYFRHEWIIPHRNKQQNLTMHILMQSLWWIHGGLVTTYGDIDLGQHCLV